MEVPALAQEGLPVVTFYDGITLHLNGEEIDIIHVPSALEAGR